MKKPDTCGEVVWRYRGVLFVACVPVLLILAIIALVPRSGTFYSFEHTHTISELRHKSGLTGPRYCIVFDAGSTGSRVHVFLFEADPKTPGSLLLVKDTFEQLKPGLSAYPDDPAKAAASLKPLLDIAIKTVPKELQSSTPLMLKATAGLRLLPGNKAQQILNAVTKALQATGFSVSSSAVGIMDGRDEGGFAWLTLNYLLGKLGGSPEDTVAAIDLGGGSVQEAFAVNPDVAKGAPSGYISMLKAAGKTFHVYVHSYLGYGLMAGRAKLVAADGSNPLCFPRGYSGVYKYGGKDFEIESGDDAPGSFDLCSHVATDALNSSQPCGAPQPQCSFSGAWRGQYVPTSASRAYYVSSYFWDRAIDSGIITDKEARTWSAKAADFADKAKSVCGVPDIPALTDQFGKAVKETELPFLCLDLTYAHVLLTKGFRISNGTQVTLVKQVEYRKQWIEAAWPLGAALDAMES